jgi:hypothetical protein
MEASNTRPHIMATLHLFSAEHAGRCEPTPPDSFSGLVGLLGSYHAIRFDLSCVGSLAPGATTPAPIPACFESPQFVLPFLRVGDAFMVRESRVVGEGVVTEILVQMRPQDAHPHNDAAPVNVAPSDGWVSCPGCRRRFKLSDTKRWNGERHMSCGQRLVIHAA